MRPDDRQSAEVGQARSQEEFLSWMLSHSAAGICVDNDSGLAHDGANTTGAEFGNLPEVLRFMELTLEQWFAELDEHQGAIPLEILIRDLPRVRMDFEAVGKFAQFSPERYRRNRMHSGPAYDALVLCWRAGQVSPIHDHRGSACAVRVIRGMATETLYEMTEEGRVFATRTRQLTEGYMCASQDLDIHQLGNAQPSGDLITLHIYSPPLLKMGQYSLDDSQPREFEDVIYELTEGAGI